MRPNRLLLLTPLTLALVLGGLIARPAGSPSGELPNRHTAQLPARLTDQQFWQLTEELSEPNGSFQSDNLLSNEIVFARIVPDLVARTKPGGVYLGVGPEQNFTYIAAIKPRMVFITDIRRGNLHLQLMYKALFELSADRAEFVSRLFTKPRPPGLTATSTATELMTAYWDATAANEASYTANLQAIHNHLTKTHALPLSADDLDGVARVYRAFYWYGPAMNYSARTSLDMSGAGHGTTYWDLMTQADASGQAFSYLASEEKFAFLKDLESKNLVVPVVGNFSGPKALRAVGAYLRERGATVTAFYLSNVEGYLRSGGTWTAFCGNVATMPLDEGSMFIRPSRSVTVTSVTGAPVATTVTIVNNAAGIAAPERLRLISSFSGSMSGPGVVPIAAEVKACGGSLTRSQK